MAAAFVSSVPPHAWRYQPNEVPANTCAVCGVMNMTEKNYIACNSCRYKIEMDKFSLTCSNCSDCKSADTCVECKECVCAAHRDEHLEWYHQWVPCVKPLNGGRCGVCVKIPADLSNPLC